jgi:hypothetical protein
MQIAIIASNIVIVLGPAISRNGMRPRTVKRKTAVPQIQRYAEDFQQQDSVLRLHAPLEQRMIAAAWSPIGRTYFDRYC